MQLKRRHFILGSLGAAGALVIGWLASPERRRLMPSTPLAAAPGQAVLNGWVKVSADNTVTVVMPQAEMGQGAHTGLAMLLADAPSCRAKRRAASRSSQTRRFMPCGLCLRLRSSGTTVPQPPCRAAPSSMS